MVSPFLRMNMLNFHLGVIMTERSNLTCCVSGVSINHLENNYVGYTTSGWLCLSSYSSQAVHTETSVKDQVRSCTAGVKVFVGVLIESKHLEYTVSNTFLWTSMIIKHFLLKKSIWCFSPVFLIFQIELYLFRNILWMVNYLYPC